MSCCADGRMRSVDNVAFCLGVFAEMLVARTPLVYVEGVRGSRAETSGQKEHDVWKRFWETLATCRLRDGPKLRLMDNFR